MQVAIQPKIHVPTQAITRLKMPRQVLPDELRWVRRRTQLHLKRKESVSRRQMPVRISGGHRHLESAPSVVCGPFSGRDPSISVGMTELTQSQSWLKLRHKLQPQVMSFVRTVAQPHEVETSRLRGLSIDVEMTVPEMKESGATQTERAVSSRSQFDRLRPVGIVLSCAPAPADTRAGNLSIREQACGRPRR